MRRRIARGFYVLICGAIAAVLGVGTSLLYSPTGRALLARIVSDQSPNLVRGSIHIGALRGSWVRGFSLDSVIVRDTSGVVMADVPHLEVSYQLPDFRAGKIVFARARLERPRITIIKHRGGRANYQEIFRLNEGPGGSKPSPLVQIAGLEIDSGLVTLRLPWNPDGRLHTQRQLDSALAAERLRPGRLIQEGREGYEQVRVFSNLTARMPLVVIATPDRRPVTLQIEHLAAHLSDPALEIRDLRGEVKTKDDSLLFQLDRAAFPNTIGRGAGRVDWPHDTLLYHFAFASDTAALSDFRWVSPQFPDFTGRMRLTAASVAGSRTEWDLRELVLGGAQGRVTGQMVAITDAYRGLGFRGLDVHLDQLDLDVVRPYLDTLPFHGIVTGPLRANGFFDRMTTTLDWTFQDARVPGGAVSTLGLDGALRLGGDSGMVFLGSKVPHADVDLRTVRLLAPAVILDGRLELEGKLDGPLKNALFEGKANHHLGDGPVSRLAGRFRLDTRGALLTLDADVRLDSLVFDGIRPSFPALATKGSLGGHVKLQGPLDRLDVDADVTGGLGHIIGKGRTALTPPHWSADSLRLTFSSLDLATLMGKPVAPVSRLQGELLASIVYDSGRAPSGRLALTLGAGRVRELPLDSASARLAFADSLIVVDTATASWNGGRLDAGGALGWAAPRRGQLRVHVEGRELAALDSLALALSGFRRDSLAGDVPLRGRGHADVTVDGALGSLGISGTAVLDSARWLGYRVHGGRGELSFDQAKRTLKAGIRADSAFWRRQSFTTIAGQVAGRPDSLSWTASGDAGKLSHLSGGGGYQMMGNDRVLRADSLGLDLLGRRWRLARPFLARQTDSLTVLDSVLFQTTDGSGTAEISGSLPGKGSGELAVTGLGIQLQDLYALGQRDTTGIAGSIAVDARLGGTAHQPTLRGTATLTGGVFGDFQAPLVRSAFDYRERLLRTNLTFWRTGLPVVRVDANLPLDLALERVESRQLPGPLTIEARGDSVDLAIAEAFTPNLRHVTGHVDIDARVEGTWKAPRLAGRVTFNDGGTDIPALGVRYEPVTGSLRLAGDSILADGMTIGGKTGSLDMKGGIWLQELTRPFLALDFEARDFTLIDVENYMKLQARAEVQLRGPLMHPVLTGRGSLANSVIYFADLVQKDIINLENPLTRDLVDTLALREQDLLSNIQSRFLDSLTIRDMDFIAREGVWLRSAEANFQLEGRVRVNKVPRREVGVPIYRLDGTFNTPRGTYTLQAGGIINRTFTVERGTVRYFGDLNADLDVEARHVVKTPQGSQGDVPVIAHITGTLLVPKLTLATPSDRLPMSEPELISLLVLGTTDPLGASLVGSRSQSFNAAATVFSNALSSELSRFLISDLGTGLDIVEIRPGFASTGFVGSGLSTPTQLAAGFALTSKLFVTANAGFCLKGGQTINAQNFGASLEYRFRRELRAVISAEPISVCRSATIPALQKGYQFGAELRWDRDY